MNIIAAFYWNGSNDKSISYMIIDSDYQTRKAPVTKKLNPSNLDSFESEAQKLIQDFFKDIENIYQGNKNGNIKIEYKIVGHASSAHQFHTKMHKPSDRTEFIREKFFEHFQKTNVNGFLQLAKQFRTNLKKPVLTEFQEQLNNLHIVKKKKNNAYQYHLWALALHATKSNYKTIINKLTKALMQEQGAQKGEKKPRAA